MSFPNSQKLGIRNTLVGFHLFASLSLFLICQKRDRDNTSEQPALLAAWCNEVKSTEFNTHLSIFLLFMEWHSWVCRCLPCRPANGWRISRKSLLDFYSSITDLQRIGNLIIWNPTSQTWNVSRGHNSLGSCLSFCLFIPCGHKSNADFYTCLWIIY